MNLVYNTADKSLSVDETSESTENQWDLDKIAQENGYDTSLEIKSISKYSSYVDKLKPDERLGIILCCIVLLSLSVSTLWCAIKKDALKSIAKIFNIIFIIILAFTCVVLLLAVGFLVFHSISPIYKPN